MQPLSIYRSLEVGPRYKLLICQKEKTDSCRQGINIKEKEDSIALLLTLKLHVFTITAYRVFCLCVNSDSVNLQPIDSNQYQFIYQLVLIINTNQITPHKSSPLTGHWLLISVN